MVSFFVLTAMFASTAIASDSLQDGLTIIIHRVDDESPDAPRSGSPFIAQYHNNWNAVQLASQDNVGNVTVTLTSTAGDWYQTVFDTSDGSILVPASGNSGHYTLTLVTSSGVTYIGEFEL